jgi:hypothetical protein
MAPCISVKSYRILFFAKKTEVNKTHQLIPGISADILGVMEPHWPSIFLITNICQVAPDKLSLIEFYSSQCGDTAKIIETSGVYYKLLTIVNDGLSVISK